MSLRRGRSSSCVGSSKPLDVLVYCTVTEITRAAFALAKGSTGNGAGPRTASPADFERSTMTVTEEFRAARDKSAEKRKPGEE